VSAIFWGSPGFEPDRCLAPGGSVVAKEMAELTHSQLMKCARESAYKATFSNCVAPPTLIKNSETRLIKLF
jgi:hypothetical protein